MLRKEKNKSPKKPLIFNIDLFKKYQSFSDQEIQSNAIELFERINKDGIKKTIQKREQQKSEYNIYLSNDDEHELVYAGAALYEFIPNIKISEAYMLAMGADIYGNVLIYSNNQKREIMKIYDFLHTSGLKVKLERCC